MTPFSFPSLSNLIIFYPPIFFLAKQHTTLNFITKYRGGGGLLPPPTAPSHSATDKGTGIFLNPSMGKWLRQNSVRKRSTTFFNY